MYCNAHEHYSINLINLGVNNKHIVWAIRNVFFLWRRKPIPFNALYATWYQAAVTLKNIDKKMLLLVKSLACHYGK